MTALVEIDEAGPTQVPFLPYALGPFSGSAPDFR